MKKFLVGALILWTVAQSDSDPKRKGASLDFAPFQPSAIPPAAPQLVSWEDPEVRRFIEANQEESTRKIAVEMRAKRTARERGINFLNRLKFGGTRTVEDGKEKVKVSPGSLRPPTFAALYYLATLQALLVRGGVWNSQGFQLAYKSYLDETKACQRSWWEVLAGNLKAVGLWLGAISSALGLVLGVIGVNPAVIASSTVALLGASAKIGMELWQASTVEEARASMMSSQDSLLTIFQELGAPPMSLVHALDSHAVIVQEEAKRQGNDCSGAFSLLSPKTGFYRIIFRLLHLSSELDVRGWPIGSMLANMSVVSGGEVKAVPIYTRSFPYEVIVTSGGQTLYRNHERGFFWGGLQGAKTNYGQGWQSGDVLLLWFDLKQTMASMGLSSAYEKIRARRALQSTNSSEWFVYSPADWKQDSTPTENRNRWFYVDVQSGFARKGLKILYEPSSPYKNWIQTYPEFSE